MTEKPTNPKDAIAVSKLPLHLVPATLNIYASLAFAEGALKYGAFNWREAGVRSSVYIDAHDRHMEKWENGEWCDPVTKVPHVASAIACLAIILDADLCGKLLDDRPLPAPVSTLVDSLEPNIRHLQELFADRRPLHRTRDNFPETLQEAAE